MEVDKDIDSFNSYKVWLKPEADVVQQAKRMCFNSYKVWLKQ